MDDLENVYFNKKIENYKKKKFGMLLQGKNRPVCMEVYI